MVTREDQIDNRITKWPGLATPRRHQFSIRLKDECIRRARSPTTEVGAHDATGAEARIEAAVGVETCQEDRFRKSGPLTNPAATSLPSGCSTSALAGTRKSVRTRPSPPKLLSRLPSGL